MTESAPFADLSSKAQDAAAMLALMRGRLRSKVSPVTCGEAAFAMLDIEPDPITAQQLSDLTGGNKTTTTAICAVYTQAGLLRGTVRGLEGWRSGPKPLTHEPTGDLALFAGNYNRLFAEHIRCQMGEAISMKTLALRGLEAFASAHGAAYTEDRSFEDNLSSAHRKTMIHPQSIVYRSFLMLAAGHGAYNRTTRALNDHVASYC